MVSSLGADKVIDYTKEDFTQKEEKYDVIFDAVAKLKPSYGKKALKENGIYLNVIKDSPTKIYSKDLIEIKEIVERGDLKPVIDKRYTLDQIAEAHRYVEKGHKKGNVLITL
jgi:NADPH:quinone reductase-like Zn-dependent oxidoreductase